MLNLRAFCLSACLIVGGFSGLGTAQSASVDAQDWDALKGRRNIFALRQALETNLGVSDGVRALGVAYIGAFSRDFDIANQNLGFARNYARARGDAAFAYEVEKVERVLMREQGRYQALSARLQKGSAWQLMVSYWAGTFTSSYIGEQEFTLENISPDDARIIISANLGNLPGTLLFDTGAESNLLSAEFATKYGAERSGIRFDMLTVDGPRSTELARLDALDIGTARFGGVPLGIQTQRDGVIGFFLNKGATGILGFPLISRFGEIDFNVSAGRVQDITMRRPSGLARSGDEPNMMIREDKPYIKVDIQDETYSCIFDTGAPRSLFSSAIIARHESELGLSYLNTREARKAGLGTKARYLEAMSFRAGHREVTLEHVQAVDAGGPGSDFCLVGLDAVISSGGGRMDMQNFQLRLGSNDSARSQVFNLR